MFNPHHSPFGFRLAATISIVATGLFAVEPAFAQLPPAPAQNVDPSPEARKQFSLGVAHLQDPDGARYEEAYRAFYRAYSLSPSWKILSNLGLSAFKLERFTDAIEAYERYLASGGADIEAAERQQIERDLELMRGSSGTVVLRTQSGEAATMRDTRQRAVGGPVTNEYALAAGATLTLQLAAGHHELAVTTAAGRKTLEFELAAGEKRELVLDAAAPPASTTAGAAPPLADPSPSAPPAPPNTSPVADSGHRAPIGAWIVGGAGALLLVAGGVTGFIGLGKKSDLEDRCPDNTCRYTSAEQKDEYESDKDSLKTLGTTTTVLLTAGGVLVAGGATWLLLGSRSDASQTGSRPVHVGAIAAPGLAAISAQGVF